MSEKCPGCEVFKSNSERNHAKSKFLLDWLLYQEVCLILAVIALVESWVRAQVWASSKLTSWSGVVGQNCFKQLCKYRMNNAKSIALIFSLTHETTKENFSSCDKPSSVIFD